MLTSTLMNFVLSGIQQLLTVAGTIPEHKTIPVSQNSRMHVSLCLSKIHEDLISDQERNLFLQVTNSFFEYVKNFCVISVNHSLVYCDDIVIYFFCVIWVCCICLAFPIVVLTLTLTLLEYQD